MTAIAPTRIRPARVLAETFELYGRHAGVLLATAAAVFAIEGAASAALGDGVLLIVALVLGMLLQALYTGLVVLLVTADREGTPIPSAGDLVMATLPFAPPLVGAGLLAALGTFAGLVLLIVPGLVALTVWSVACAVVVIERLGPVGSLRRSRELVRGDGWPVFGVMLATVVLAIAIGFPAGLVAEEAGVLARVLVEWAVAVVAAPVVALPTVVLYHALRERR